MAETKAEADARIEAERQAKEADKVAKEAAKAEAERIKNLPRATAQNALTLIVLRSLALAPLGLGRLGELLLVAANAIESGDKHVAHPLEKGKPKAKKANPDEILVGIANALEDDAKDWSKLLTDLEALLGLDVLEDQSVSGVLAAMKAGKVTESQAQSMLSAKNE